MIADMLSNKNLNPIVTELFIRGKKLNISLLIMTILFRCSQNTILFSKLQIYENFNKLHLISHQI